MRLPSLAAVVFLSIAVATPATAQQTAAIDLWNQNKVAFGIFVPGEDPASRPPVYTQAVGAKLAGNPLYDFLFLNLEPRYDPGAIKAIASGLRHAGGTNRKTLIVRIPTIERDGLDAAKARIKEAFDLGADGVTVPHVRSAEEAARVIGYFRDARVDIWSPANRKGDKLAMLMIEDPGALAQAKAIADLKDYSILACGIGSLTQALGGNRDAAEAGTRKVLAETKRTRLVNMLTTSARDVEQRVKEGFLALIAQGRDADEVIANGRKAAGRSNSAENGGPLRRNLEID